MCVLNEKNLILYFGLIDETIDYSDNEQPVYCSNGKIRSLSDLWTLLQGILGDVEQAWW